MNLLAVTLIVLTGTLGHPAALGFRVNSNYLERTLGALESALGYYFRDYAHVNLDGLYGLRVAQGELVILNRVIQQGKLGYVISSGLDARVRNLSRQIEAAAWLMIPAIRDQDSKYFQGFYDTIKEPFIVERPLRTIIGYRNAQWQLADFDPMSYNEQKGDRCFMEMLGTIANFGDHYRETPKCTIRSECWDFMTTSTSIGYHLTHQLLYFILAKQIGCLPHVLTIRSRSWLEDFKRRTCGAVHSQAAFLTTTGRGSVAPPYQDLFLEQQSVCGLLGFQEFFRPDWLQMSLSWQDRERGCFTMRRRRRDSYSTMRKVLMENVSPDNCLSHKSGLGTAVFGLYFRYLVEHQGKFV